jgi:hypothetical protein
VTAVYESRGTPTRYFLNKWAITYLIEQLPHEDNSRRWDGKELVPVELDLDSDDLKADVITLQHGLLPPP